MFRYKVHSTFRTRYRARSYWTCWWILSNGFVICTVCFQETEPTFISRIWVRIQSFYQSWSFFLAALEIIWTCNYGLYRRLCFNSIDNSVQLPESILLIFSNLFIKNVDSKRLVAELPNALVPYPTMHHSVTEICPCAHTSITKW